MSDTSGAPQLQRTMGAGMLALYGLGSMLGAGIYGLVGKAAGMLGGAVWASFVIAMAAAILTGLSYAALGARYPRAGGAAYVIQRAFGFARVGVCRGACSRLRSGPHLDGDGVKNCRHQHSRIVWSARRSGPAHRRGLSRAVVRHRLAGPTGIACGSTRFALSLKRRVLRLSSLSGARFLGQR